MICTQCFGTLTWFPRMDYALRIKKCRQQFIWITSMRSFVQQIFGTDLFKLLEEFFPLQFEYFPKSDSIFLRHWSELAIHLLTIIAILLIRLYTHELDFRLGGTSWKWALSHHPLVSLRSTFFSLESLYFQFILQFVSLSFRIWLEYSEINMEVWRLASFAKCWKKRTFWRFV